MRGAASAAALSMIGPPTAPMLSGFWLGGFAESKRSSAKTTRKGTRQRNMIPSIEENEFDKAYHVFCECGLEENFAPWFDYHMSSPASERTYVYRGPDYMGWFKHCSKDEDPDAPDDFWMINYLSISSDRITLRDVVEMLPYGLPFFAFGRAIRGRKDLRFFPAGKIESLCRLISNRHRYAKQQETSRTSGPSGCGSGSGPDSSGPCGDG